MSIDIDPSAVERHDAADPSSDILVDYSVQSRVYFSRFNPNFVEMDRIRGQDDPNRRHFGII